MSSVEWIQKFRTRFGFPSSERDGERAPACGFDEISVEFGPAVLVELILDPIFIIGPSF